jgi:hypothetical protein
MSETVDIEHLLNPENLAVEIANRWNEWNMLRAPWIEQTKELRNYIYATDTTTTGNAILPWSNTTTTPKLTQISDNLHANYFATLFPQQKWMRWEADNQSSGGMEKSRAIQSYMLTKTKHSGLVSTVSDLLVDWIATGNCFAMVEWEADYIEKKDGTTTPKYIGPRTIRISPYDICFNPIASSFEKSPKIIRTIKSMGELKRDIDRDPSNTTAQAAFSKMINGRSTVSNSTVSVEKSQGFVADGFSSIQQYYESDYVELLTFYGDIYDHESGSLMKDRIITVMDRAHVLNNEENPSWFGTAPIFHAGWRTRPDNLYAMGPLDNLVGMQYRIDHLENLKADVFDQIAYPIMKIRGDVEDFDFEPGARIYLGEEGDVAYLAPDGTALQADMQINALEIKMEEMAGAPKQAMGIRTPGEKTAFEVQSLQNGASRIFEHKTAHFERMFLEPVLNAMLETGRRNMSLFEDIRVVDEETGEEFFMSISRSDIVGSGKISPIGARHFAERARRVQSLTQLSQIKAGDPSVAPHLSGKELARILSEELGEPRLFGENIAIKEQLETQSAMQEAELQNQEELAMAAEQGR